MPNGGRATRTASVDTDVTLALTSAATGLSDLRNQFSSPLRILVGVVGIVLLIACANTGNLVLARAAARRAEFAVRLALGASRSRLIRQVLVEGLVLASLAGACGIGLAYLATQVLVTYVSAGRSPVTLDLTPDARLLAFTAAVSLLTGLLFASVPAFRASRLDMAATGRKDLAGTRHGVGGLQPGRWLVVCQVALSLLLLITAGLFVRSLQNLQRQDAGADRNQILIVRVEPRGSDQRNVPGVTARLDGIYRDLLDRVERLPGVQAASLARTAPLAPIGFASRVTGPSGGQVNTQILMIYPKYFATMGLSIARGRDFNEADLRPGAPFVALANETFVRQVLEGRQDDRPGDDGHGRARHGRDHRRRQGLPLSRPSQHDAADAVSDVPSDADRPRTDGAPRPCRRQYRAPHPAASRGGAGHRQGCPDLRDSQPGRGDERRLRPRAPGRDAVGVLRRRGADARLRRPLRAHVVHRGTADGRDWRPRGARRRAWQRGSG